MDKDIQRIYNLLKEITVFKDMPQCVNCSNACDGAQWMSWLLPEEVDKLKNKYGLDIAEVGNASFNKKVRCKLHKEGVGCTIYDDRALACRLSPITFLKINGEVWWVLITYCPIIGEGSEEELEEIKKKVESYVSKIEPLITLKIKKDVNDICDAINTFAAPVDDVDYVKVVRFF